MPAFCRALQPVLVACDAGMCCDGELRAFADDVYVVGDPASLRVGAAIEQLHHDALGNTDHHGNFAVELCARQPDQTHHVA